MNRIVHDHQDCSYCEMSLKKACLEGDCYSVGSLLATPQLIIYVSWIGTDLVGQHFISHTLRLKKLNTFSHYDIYEAGLGVQKKE